jgi:hypothetical protein
MSKRKRVNTHARQTVQPGISKRMRVSRKPLNPMPAGRTALRNSQFVPIAFVSVRLPRH